MKNEAVVHLENTFDIIADDNALNRKDSRNDTEKLVLAVIPEKSDVISEISEKFQKVAIENNLPAGSIDNTENVPCKILDDKIENIETLPEETSTPNESDDLIICSNSTTSVHNETSSLNGAVIMDDILAPDNQASTNNNLHQVRNAVSMEICTNDTKPDVTINNTDILTTGGQRLPSETNQERDDSINLGEIFIKEASVSDVSDKKSTTSDSNPTMICDKNEEHKNSHEISQQEDLLGYSALSDDSVLLLENPKLNSG